MNKKQVLASLVKIANEFDNQGEFEFADILTQVGVRIAQWDDEGFGGGDHERYEDELGNHEMNELTRDHWLDDHDEPEEEEGSFYRDIDSAVSDIHSQQVAGMNETFYVFQNDEGLLYAVPDSTHTQSHDQFVKAVPAMTKEELAAYVDYQRQQYEDIPGETPLGMELDDPHDPMDY
jgi:hypothetical protein